MIEWKPVKNFERYSVSSSGEILNTKTGRKLKPRPVSEKNPYPAVVLCDCGVRKTLKVHRLVALAFIPNPGNLPVVNHKDGNKVNSQVDNLEWVTTSENIWHSYETGLH